MPVDVLFVDNHLLALNKPAGLVTQPSPHHQDSLEDRAKAWIAETYRKPGRVFLEAVHRLDRPVSGVVLFGRTSKALSRLNAAIRHGDSGKRYLALVEGHPPAAGGELRHWLRHDDFHATVVEAETAGAKACVLRYRVVTTLRGLDLLELDLVTGRYHQIRAQLAEVGCPIAGDTHYGARSPWPGDGIALHHARLTLEHPVRREQLVIEAPLPACWELA